MKNQKFEKKIDSFLSRKEIETTKKEAAKKALLHIKMAKDDIDVLMNKVCAQDQINALENAMSDLDDATASIMSILAARKMLSVFNRDKLVSITSIEELVNDEINEILKQS